MKWGVLDSCEFRAPYRIPNAEFRDHNYYYVKDNGKFLCKTKISKDPKHTLSDDLVSMRGRQLLIGGGNFVKFVRCTLSKDEVLKIIQGSLAIASVPAPQTQRQNRTQ
ncbi:MAG: hypothetical protein WBQ89_17035 [Candidatus Acidiferrum sp.]